MFIPGITRLDRSQYADARNPRGSKEPALDQQPQLQWYMDRYPTWRSLYDGTALEETMSATQDPASSSPVFRWPVRFNLISSYCQLHAGMLWGHGRSGSSSTELFRVRVDPKIPGRKTATEMAPRLQDVLNYFWSRQSHILRANSAIQQWAGGAVIKVSWRPDSRQSVYGIVLETIQPEHFFPIWNPTNFDELYAVKIKFTVSKAVAMARYNLTDAELRRFGDRDRIPVEEYWDAARYYIVLGKDQGDKGVVARREDGSPLKGPNPFIHPRTRRGVIPVHYIPRIRTGGYLGESLAYRLEGIQQEMNKTLADYGDALTRGAHPAMGISDYTGPGSKKEIIAIPRHGALNLGPTAPGGTSPKVHTFPLPQVPPQTGEFLERLHGMSEAVAGLTPAARGVNQGKESGLAIALQMLPTTNLVDWERAHVAQSLAGGGGLHDTLLAIWWSKRGRAAVVDSVLPSLGDSESIFDLDQDIEYAPVIPRDRLDVIDEVVRLSTNPSVSPREWLKRLGDIEDLDEEWENLKEYLIFVAEKEAAVAGRAIKVSEPTNPRNPERAYPTISGETAEPAPKQAPKQPQGVKPQDRS